MAISVGRVVDAGTGHADVLALPEELLASDRFQAAVTDLGGYSTKEMGRRLR